MARPGTFQPGNKLRAGAHNGHRGDLTRILVQKLNEVSTIVDKNERRTRGEKLIDGLLHNACGEFWIPPEYKKNKDGKKQLIEGTGCWAQGKPDQAAIDAVYARLEGKVHEKVQITHEVIDPETRYREVIEMAEDIRNTIGLDVNKVLSLPPLQQPDVEVVSVKTKKRA